MASDFPKSSRAPVEDGGGDVGFGCFSFSNGFMGGHSWFRGTVVFVLERAVCCGAVGTQVV